VLCAPRLLPGFLWTHKLGAAYGLCARRHKKALLQRGGVRGKGRRAGVPDVAFMAGASEPSGALGMKAAAEPAMARTTTRLYMLQWGVRPAMKS
jgi:hypothetical protein